MRYEKEILTDLAEHYRRSKKDSGDNKTNRRTQAKPERFYKKYRANDGDFEEISKLNQAVEDLTKAGFIYSEKETFGTQIQCIYLVDEKIRDVERYLADKYGYVSKDMQMARLQALVEKYKDASPICEKECMRLTEYLKTRKVPKNLDILDDILKAVAFIEKNREDLSMREVSMQVYGDSKFLENETLLSSVCGILRRYGKRDLADGEMKDEILSEYHITKEPQKLCIRGKAVLCVSGKETDISGFSGGVEFSASDLARIQWVKLLAPKFMTIENRTSYLRYQQEDVVTFYLGGYADRYQRDFVKLIYASNASTRYLHFGDIDAGGFWIHHNLCEATGVKFELFGMSVEELEDRAYSSCLHGLTENDRARLRELKEMEPYGEVVSYMLEHGVKLEQEIVSLELMKGGR